MRSYGTQLRPRQDQLVAYSGVRALLTNLAGAIEGPKDGYFEDDGRLLSKAVILIDGQPLEVFAAARLGSHGILVHGRAKGDGDLLEDALFVRITWKLLGSALNLEVRLVNHASRRHRSFELSMAMAADFADFQEAQKGGPRQQTAPVHFEWHESDRELRFEYGHPRLPLCTVVSIVAEGAPLPWKNDRFVSTGILAPQQELIWRFDVHREPRSLAAAVFPVQGQAEPPPAPRLVTSNPTVSLAWETAVRDLQSLPLGLSGGVQALAAGVPLYLHFFGRDTLTAGWQALLAGPEYLRDALILNALVQGTKVDDSIDEQPGKLIHEARSGPLSLLGEDPLLRNYGDYATPPDFVVMLAQYYSWTGDAKITRSLLPAAWRALEWLETYGDLDHDGFLEYVTRAPKGVKNQGWKDAPDSIVDDQGNIAPNPLATSELQAYWYAALQFGAFLAAAVARDYGLALKLRRRAGLLKRQFNDAFWIDKEGHYALALDNRKQPIRAAGSNDAHLLVTGIVPRERATRVVRRLFQADIFTGWGIRTLSSDHPAYNPFSYHRGSVWPVEHGTFALGLARYGFWQELSLLAKGVFDASELFEEHRLPEVLGGLQRDADGGHPGIYPGSCWPQAWTASTVVMIVQALLGLNAVAPLRTAFVDPHLPNWLPDLRLAGIRIGDTELDLKAWRTPAGKTHFRMRKTGRKLLVLRQAPPQDPAGTLKARIAGLRPR